jgi:uncharacterized protein (DUF2384 family)
MMAEPTGTEVSLEKLQQELILFFDSDFVDIEKWINTPISRLDGHCPRNFFDTSEQRKLLYHVIQEMKFGDFA